MTESYYEDEGPGRHDERCPTCGRYVSTEDGFGDLPPGGFQSIDYLACYCDAGCAERKSPRCYYEDDPDYDDALRRRRAGK